MSSARARSASSATVGPAAISRVSLWRRSSSSARKKSVTVFGAGSPPPDSGGLGTLASMKRLTFSPVPPVKKMMTRTRRTRARPPRTRAGREIATFFFVGHGPYSVPRMNRTRPAVDRLGDPGLERVRGQLLLFVGVGDERGLDEDGRAGDAGQDLEGGLLDAPVARPEHGVELLLDELGQTAALLDVGRLGHVPEDHHQVVVGGGVDAGLELGGVVLEVGQAARLLVGRVEAEEEGLRAGRLPLDGAVGVDADEQAGLVVVGDGGPVLVRDVDVAVAGQDDREAHVPLDQGLELEADGQGDVLFEVPELALGAGLHAAVAGVDDHGLDARDLAGRLAGAGAGGREEARRTAARAAVEAVRMIDRVFTCKSGGGGGNRTRVRKHSTAGLYTLIPFLDLVARRSKGKGAGKPAPKVFRSPASGPKPVRYPARLTLRRPCGREPPERRAFLLGRDC